LRPSAPGRPAKARHHRFSACDGSQLQPFTPRVLIGLHTLPEPESRYGLSLAHNDANLESKRSIRRPHSRGSRKPPRQTTLTSPTEHCCGQPRTPFHPSLATRLEGAGASSGRVHCLPPTLRSAAAGRHSVDRRRFWQYDGVVGSQRSCKHSTLQTRPSLAGEPCRVGGADSVWTRVLARHPPHRDCCVGQTPRKGRRPSSAWWVPSLRSASTLPPEGGRAGRLAHSALPHVPRGRPEQSWPRTSVTWPPKRLGTRRAGGHVASWPPGGGRSAVWRCERLIVARAVAALEHDSRHSEAVLQDSRGSQTARFQATAALIVDSRRSWQLWSKLQGCGSAPQPPRGLQHASRRHDRHDSRT